MSDPSAKRSDLPTRVGSAIVMVLAAGLALWLGGAVWIAFVGAAAAVVLWEWRALVRALAGSATSEAAWMLGGVLYIGIAAATLMALRTGGVLPALLPVLAVAATDVGAYFAGRTFGGPKIAPRISPSKTWAGLIGGMLGASATMVLAFDYGCQAPVGRFGADGCASAATTWQGAIALGIAIAIVAQAGDFFESWMKRRAGVKDSGKLLPGHGGVFDRVDGLLAVLFASALLLLGNAVL